jgi:DNA invertase Pin-like site-specific DNA recombinase
MNPKMPSQSIAVGYIRVSTDDQSLGPEAQREAIEAYCASRGFQLVDVRFDLGVSGGTALEKRPGLLAALDALKVHRAGLLLVAKRDRLARDVVVAALVERLAEKHGATVESADGVGAGGGPEAQLMRTLVDAFAAYERALIRSRTKAALAVKRSRGERIGEVPYGLRVTRDGKLETSEAEAFAVARVRKLRGEGFSIRAIAQRLDAEGLKPRGARWHPNTVARLLSRAA